MKLSSANQQDENNTPLVPPTESPKKKTDFDRTLWYTIGGIVLVSCCGIILLVFLYSRTSQFKQFIYIPPLEPDTTNRPYITSTQRPTPAPGQPTLRPPTPNKQLTQAAWIKPAQNPLLGSAEDAQNAVDDSNVDMLRSVASYMPNIPRVPQPGDIYYYGINLEYSHQLLWDYRWCASSAEIRDQDLGRMKIEFTVNTRIVSPQYIAIRDYKESDKSYCRTYHLLIVSWPRGIHLLETNITFLQSISDGRKEFPAGMHTFLYRVTLNP